MVTKEEVLLAFERITAGRIARIGDSIHGLFLQPVDFGQKLHLSTIVYIGDKFIPSSVRKAASCPLETSPLDDTWLSIDEERYVISLHFLDSWAPNTRSSLYELTSQFEEVALRWREIFEEKDRQDLVHIHQSR